MDHWTIGDAELRRQVGAQTERYRELRRRSDKVRLLEAGLGPRPTLLQRLSRCLEAVLGRRRPRAVLDTSHDAGLEHR